MTIKNDEKFEEHLTCRFNIDIRNLMIFDSTAWKVSKVYTLMGCFWPKYIIFELKKYRGVMFDSTEYWCKIWRKTDLCFQKWHEEFNKLSPERGRKSKNWDFDEILWRKVENVWE